MDVNIASIIDSFSVTSLKPVTLKGAGKFMQKLEGIFQAEQEKLTPVAGLPEGVYTIASQPQTREGLQITPVDVPPAGV